MRTVFVVLMDMCVLSVRCGKLSWKSMIGSLSIDLLCGGFWAGPLLSRVGSVLYIASSLDLGSPLCMVGVSTVIVRVQLLVLISDRNCLVTLVPCGLSGVGLVAGSSRLCVY